MNDAPLYDRIGVNYADLRRPDLRIATVLHAALGDARHVLNIGAGTGSYEPADRQVTAVEPSAAMIAKRPAGAAPVVQASAEDLPFPDGHFDAALAIFTVHHWHDKAAGMAELRRVTRGPIVIVTYDPVARPWPTDYFPGLIALDERVMPAMADYARWLGPVTATPLLVPHDCSDGFLYAYWRRPHAYLDPHIRSGSSAFWLIDGVEQGATRLRADLDSGVWAQRHADLLHADAWDVGYRLVVSS